MKRSRSVQLFLIGIGVLASLVMAACGDAESHLTKAQFLRQGNAICERAAADQVRRAGKYNQSELAYYGPVTDVFVPPMEKELRQLEVLSPPPGDEELVGAILQATRRGVEDAKADYLDLLAKAQDPYVKANALARKYGLNACAQSSHAVFKPQG